MSRLILPLLALLFVLMHYEVEGSPGSRSQHFQSTKVRPGPRIYHADSKRWPYFYRAWYLPSFPSLSSVSSFWDDDEEDVMKAMKKRIEALENSQKDLLALLKKLTAEKVKQPPATDVRQEAEQLPSVEQPKTKPESGEANKDPSVAVDEAEGASQGTQKGEQSVPSTMTVAEANASEATKGDVTENAVPSPMDGQKQPLLEKDVLVENEETENAKEQRPEESETTIAAQEGGVTTSQVDASENPEPIVEAEKPQVDLSVSGDEENSTSESYAALADAQLEVQENNEEKSEESAGDSGNASAEIENAKAPPTAEIAVVAFVEPMMNDETGVEDASESQAQ